MQTRQTISPCIDTYEPLILEQELATKQYASTLASLELARIETEPVEPDK